VQARAVEKTVQLFGGLGYMRGSPVERAFRDARICEIFEGTNEINRVVVATNLLRGAGVRISA
jgi:alkylation response protein AidB-like acyl-CoA dehydrogenase